MLREYTRHRLFSFNVSYYNSRFEELSDGFGEEPKKPEPKQLKRPLDEAMETDEQPAEKLSKSAKKKAKKQKGEDGKAVPVATTEPKEEKEKEKEKKADKKDKKEVKKQKAAKEDYQELLGGVKIRDVKTGDGKTAKSGARVSMRYVGKLQNKQIFDQNVKGKPVSNFFLHLLRTYSLCRSSLSNLERVM
jgi:FK506-binding nuclear protein